jgi:hypothetical protein
MMFYVGRRIKKYVCFIWQREKLSLINNSEGNEKFVPKSVMHFQTWRIGNPAC